MNDEEFLRKFSKGQRVLKRYAMVLTGNEAQAAELYQQTVVRAYERRESRYAIADFTHWMGVLMRELHQDNYSEYECKITVNFSSEHTERLPEDIRCVVQLAASGCSSYEIAARLGLTRSTVKNRIRVAKMMAGKMGSRGV